MAKPTNDPNLFGPLVLEGPAVGRDRSAEDKNDSVKPNEDEWLKRADAQDAEITAAEIQFFATLRERMGR